MEPGTEIAKKSSRRKLGEPLLLMLLGMGCLLATLTIAAIIAFAFSFYDPLSALEVDYDRLISPDGKHAVVLGYRSTYKMGFGAVWLVDVASIESRDEWKQVIDWTPGEARAEWESDDRVLIYAPNARSKFAEFNLNWHGVEVQAID